MKPRFSILTLLVVTAYVAIQLAALPQKSSFWTGTAFYAHAATVVCLVAIACGKPTNTTVFARGLVLGIILYSEFQTKENQFTSPYGDVFNWWNYFNADTGYYQDLVVERASGVAFGLICGSLALWRYRVQERRANQEKVE